MSPRILFAVGIRKPYGSPVVEMKTPTGGPTPAGAGEDTPQPKPRDVREEGTNER